MAFFLLLACTVTIMTPAHAMDDIHPAKIFMKQVSTVGGEVEAVCNTFGFKNDPSESAYIYLCKNGTGINMQLQNKDHKTTFILKNVTKEHTGNYSCVFSKSKYEVSKVQRAGENCVFFQVIDDFIPANIAVRDGSVREGDDVVLRCSLRDVQIPHKGSSTSFAYLCKDGAPVQLQTWDTERNEANFTIKSITEENNGNYSCVLFKPGLLTSTAMKLYGNNAVILSASATFSGSTLTIGLWGFNFLLILVMMLGVWWYRVTRKGKSNGGPEMKQEEENKNSTEIQHTTANVPVLETFQETDCYPYESTEFSDESETNFAEENRLYHEIETEPPLYTTG